MKQTLQQNLSALIQEGIDSISLPNQPELLYEPIRYTLDLGGKRIRPLLCMLSCGICGGIVDNALPSALAIEVLHNFTLIHDDIMDQAEIRRGHPSVYKKWDEATAILSGDAMFGKAYELLNFYGIEDAYTKTEFLSIHKSFQYAVKTVCEGQALDMQFVSTDEVSIELYLQMIIGKTSALLSSAMEMGALSAHDNTNAETLFEIGKQLGIAFQIQDDLLDVIADPKKFGKKAGGDIYEGKKTYLSLLALERGNNEQNAVLNKVLSSSSNSDGDVKKVIDLYKELNVIDDTITEIDSHYNKAMAAINNFDDSDYKSELIKLLLFLKNREY